MLNKKIKPKNNNQPRINTAVKLSGRLYAFILIGVIMVLSYIPYPASTIPQMHIREFGDQIRTKICMPLNVKNIIIRKRNKDVYTNITFKQMSLSGIPGNFGLAKAIKGSYTSNDDSENRNYKIRTIILWFLYFIHIAIISIGVFILRFKRVTNRRFIVGLIIIIIGFIFGILVLDQLFTPPYIEKIISI